MKNLNKLFIVFVLLFAFSILFGCTEQPKACTKEAKICPDGSAVGRTLPDCEFASCPTVDSNFIIVDNFCGCNYCIMEAKRDFNVKTLSDFNADKLGKKCSDYNRIEICAKELKETNETIGDCLNGN